MPCRSDYPDPTARQRNNRRAAELLWYVYDMLGVMTPDHIREQAIDTYGVNSEKDDDWSVITLCATVKGMNAETRERIVYNSKSRIARDLANWWEDHEAADLEREREEAENNEKEALRQSALSKLTQAEAEALGISK
jgi:hypothetical protein